MSEFEKAVTGLGEECGVFGAYDVDGHDVAASVYYCSDRHLWEEKRPFKKRTWPCG